MRKKSLVIFIITILSLAGFVFVFTKLNQRKTGSSNVSIFADAKRKEEQEIKENTLKYQPKETERTKKSGLELSAKSAIVVDESTGEIVYEKEPHLALPPASITKIDTLSVALETLRPDELIDISEKAASQEANKISLKAGEKMLLADLLYGLMMISANDAAMAIAEAVPGGYDKFISLMNDKVRMLGLTDTKFTNPSGLDEPEHRSSAFDIATLTRYALMAHPEVVEYAGKKEDHSVYPSEHNESHWWGHISAMLFRYPGMIMAKTGYTDEAKSTFIGVAERNGKRMTVVLLGSTDANNDVPKLLDFGFAN